MKNTLDLTSEEIKELEELKKHPVDYSDIPETLDFSKAKFKYYNITPKKEPITFRLDADLIAVMKGTGKGYQTKVNEILRNYFMDQSLKKI